MAGAFAIAISAIQTVVVILGAAFAWINIRKFKDSRGVDFILNAESKIDPAYLSLMEASPAVIRTVYARYDLTNLNDDQCKALPFMDALYLHVSRIAYILLNPRLDLGLSRSEKDEILRIWLVHLEMFRGNSVMQVVHQAALRDRDVNETFLRLAIERLGPPLPPPSEGATDERRPRVAGAVSRQTC